jgi:hypothetical protein
VQVGGWRALLLLAGCTAPVQKTVAVPGRAPVVTADEVRVFKRGQTPPQPYEILGAVGSVARGKGMKYVPEKKALKLMKAEAAAMGANALVGFFADDDRTHSSAWWAASLAVRMPPAADSEPVERQPVVVAVPLAVFDEANTNQTAASLQRISQRFAEYYLIGKGYYPHSLGRTLELTVSALKAMPEAELKTCGGPDADFLLLLNHTTTSRRYSLIVNSSADAYEAVLFSKRTREVVWQNTGAGGVTEGILSSMIINPFWPNRTKVLRTNAAMGELMKTAPEVAGSVRQ